MVDAVSVIATVQRLLAKHGRSVTFIEFDSTLADPSKPWNGPSDPDATPDSTLALDAVFLEPSGAAQLGLLAKENDLLKRSEQILIVSPGAANDLRIYQEVSDGSTSYKIQGVHVLRPGAEILLAYVGVRR